MTTQDQKKKFVVDPKTVELIEKVVYHEAKGEGQAGRDAVRAVIYNRIASGEWGNSALSVLNAKWQFQPVMEKARGDARRLKVPPEDKKNLVDEHLEFLKRGVDPTNGATFFLNPGAARNPFNQGQQGLKIGNHVFFDNYKGNKVEVPKFSVSLRGFSGLKADLQTASLTFTPTATSTVANAPKPKPVEKSNPITDFIYKLNPFSNDSNKAAPAPASTAPAPSQTSQKVLATNVGDDALTTLPGFNKGGMPEDELFDKLKTAADVVTDFVPIVGEAKSGYQAVQSYNRGDYGEAALNAVGALPLVGGMVRGARKGAKAVDAVSEVFQPLNKVGDAQETAKATKSKAQKGAETTFSPLAETPTPKAATPAQKQNVDIEKTEGEKLVQASADLSKALANTIPEKTVKAYKLFRTDPKRPGEYFPLFVNADKGVPVGQWIDAEVGPLTAKGGVKSKIGDLAYRPGWHAGDYASATHIGGKSGNGLTAPDYRRANQVWAEVELPNDVDWQSIANSRASTVKSGPNKGQPNVKEAHITDQVPFGGHYRYKTNSNMQGNWLIGGSMKVNKTLSPDEVKAVEKATGIADLPSLPELIDQKGLSLKDLSKESVKELKTYYPDKFAEMGGKPGMFAGGLMEYEDDYESEDDMSCGMMAPEMFDMVVGTDPVSGNPIPPGSSPENVRDDIPAVLSDGEYVVPADVVRYHGLKTFMSLRDEAKMGLMSMYAEGQIRPIDEEMTDEDSEAEEEESDGKGSRKSAVSAKEDSAEEGDEELPEGEYETPEGNMVETAMVETEEEGMEVEEDEDAAAYAKKMADFYGDEEIIVLFKKYPELFKPA